MIAEECQDRGDVDASDPKTFVLVTEAGRFGTGEGCALFRTAQG